MLITVPLLGEINLYTEIIGLIALVVVIIGYTGNTKKQFYLTQTIANILLSIGFLIKGNLLSGIGIAIATVRSLTFLIFDLKNKQVPYYLVGLFIALLIANGIYCWTGIFDLLSIVALICNTIFCMIKDQRKMKIFMISPVSMTIIYDIIAVFILKAILKIIELISILIFLISKKKKSETNENNLKNQENTLIETSNDLT